MGGCLDCLSDSSPPEAPPDPEERRRKLEEAAVKRQKENEGRGLKNPEKVKRQQQKREAAEKEALKSGSQGEGLKKDMSVTYAAEDNPGT